MVLELDRDDLIDFLDDFLAPYKDEENPSNNVAGMVVELGAVTVDKFRTVWQYRFSRPYLYMAWRNFPPLPQQRQQWYVQLGQALEQLYYPYAPRLTNKLTRLFEAGKRPDLAAPYRQRRIEQFTLDSLRWHVNTRLQQVKQDPTDTFTLYRLFDVGLQLLDKLARNATYGQEGVALAQQIIPLAETVADEVVLADLSYYLGFHHYNKGQYVEGKMATQTALQLAETHTLPDTDLALYNSLMGGLLNAMGELAAARPFYERALAINEEVIGATHPDTATSLNNMGTLLQAMGALEAARPFFERALAIREEVLGATHPDTALSLNNMGFLLQAMGELEAARPFYERALAIREEVLGTTHPDTASSLNNMGFLLQAMGELAAARPFYERALAIYEEVLGATHPDTALSLNNMGTLLQAMGDWDAARPHYERALTIHEEVLGATHPDTANSLNNMGTLLQAIGELDGARPFYERALAIHEEVLGATHPDTANSLWWMGVLAEEDDHLVEAKNYYLRAYNIYLQALGSEHPSTKNVQGFLQRIEAKLS